MTTGARVFPRQAIAVIGLGGRFPGAPTVRQFWRNLADGVESLDTFTDAEMDAAGVPAALRALPGWVARGTVLEQAEAFDAAFFGYAPREAQIIDPQQRVFLECAWEALEDAGYAGEPAGRTVAIYAGSSLNSYVYAQLMPNRDLVATVGGYQMMIGNDKDFLTTRASYKLDLHGPSMAIQTACSTSLVAVQVACQALVRGECDMALAGGVSITFPQTTGYLYQEGMIFSPDGSCRPFDVQAQGTRSGDGAGLVVLKRLDDAIADRDTVHAVILGAAINNDGAGKAGYTAPSVEGQMEVIATAQALAGVTADTISYIEAHGTATPLGDPIEVAALTRVFRGSTDAVGFCALGSLKANLGHLDAAAGVAGLIKTVLALKHRALPPQLNFSAPNPQLNLVQSPFRVVTTHEPWRAGVTPRRAGVSSFGIGGTNAHVVLEEAPEPTPGVVRREAQLLVVSAKTVEALDTATSNLVMYLREPDAAALSDVAYTLQVGRREFAHRRSVVAATADDAIALLSDPARSPVVTGQHSGAARPVAFLFSGQGSQHAGMGAQLYQSEETFRAAVDRCAELLQPHFGRDIRTLLWTGTDSELSETHVAQPALFVCEYALAVLWMSWGVHPTAMLGHSIGEYVAAHLAGVFSLEDALLLVAARGRLMQGMPAGEMLAVRLSAAELRPRLVPGVEIAAINAPALCTVSGTREAIEQLTQALERDGVEHRPLHTSHAFHSAMMEPALAPFREIVSRVSLSAPHRPVVSNVTGTWLQPEQATSPDYWTAHLREAVRFADGVTTLLTDPAMQLLEVGPGTALTALARLSVGREGAARVSSSLPHPREQRSEASTMLTAAGRLWTAGAAVDCNGLHSGESLRRVSLPTYPFERKRHWVEAPSAATAAAAGAETSVIARRSDVGDWFTVPRWMRRPVTALHSTALTGHWLVFGSGDALESATCDALHVAGVTTTVVRVGSAFTLDDARSAAQVRADSSEDHEQLLRTLTQHGRQLRGALHLWAVEDTAPDATATTARGLALFALGRALVLEHALAPFRLVVGSLNAQSVLGETIQWPGAALATGAVLVLPHEHEMLQASVVDLETLHDVGSIGAAVAALVAEAGQDDADQFTALRGGQRFVQRYESMALPTAVSTDHAPLRQNGVYLITGGLGGIGSTFARWMASRVSARLVLTARQALPARDGWDDWLRSHDNDDPTSQRLQLVREIEASGGEVMMLSGDVSDADTLRADLQLVRERWGPLHGMVHAAGIADDALLALYEPDSALRTLRAKAAGTDALIAAVGDQPLDFALFCSSINAAVGNAGSAAYTAGNAYLDAMAESARVPTQWRPMSMAWGAWRDVGMTTRERGVSAERKAHVAAGITPAEGIDAFVRAKAAGVVRCVVSPFDLETVHRRRHRARSRQGRGPEQPVTIGSKAVPASRADSSLIAAPDGDVEQRLVEIWEDLLGVSPIGVHDNFFEMGGHSLMATRVIARVEQSHGVRLPLREIFNAPTIRQLAGLVTAALEAQGAPMDAVASGEREEFEL